MVAVQKKQENYTNKAHILIVDDDVRICDLVSRYLGDRDFVVMNAGSADEARQILGRFEFDALVVDVMMPKETGLEFIANLRQNSDIPVLLLTALGEVDNRIEGLEAGADDYLPKPFEPRELVLRLNAILKRARAQVKVVEPFSIGAWYYDPAQSEISRGSEHVTLTAMEANLLNALAQRKGEVMSRSDLAQACGVDAGERTIDVQVTRLRKKIEEDSKEPQFLKTIRGKGYVLRGEG